MTQPRRVYLDHNATTPLCSEARDALIEAVDQGAGNPSSLHWAGLQARRRVERARAQVASAVGARPSEVLFTSGGTESNTTAIDSLIERATRSLPHIVTVATEHKAILDTLARAQQIGRAEVTVVPVDDQGDPDWPMLASALAASDGLCMMAANNETGTVADLDRVAALVTDAGVPWHCDAVQAFGKLPLRFHEGPAKAMTSMALAAHKLYGPPGVGALIVRTGAPLTPLFVGGGQEGGRRAGTENTPNLAAFGAAAEVADARAHSDTPAAIATLRDRLQRDLLERLPGSQVHGHPQRRLPNTLSVAVRAQTADAWPDAELLMLELNRHGFAVSTGAACASRDRRPSHVLSAMGVTPAQAQATLRVSLGHTTTDLDLRRFAEVLAGAVADAT